MKLRLVNKRSDTGKDTRQEFFPPKMDVCKKLAIQVVCALIYTEKPRKKKKRIKKY